MSGYVIYIGPAVIIVVSAVVGFFAFRGIARDEPIQAPAPREPDGDAGTTVDDLLTRLGGQ